jgi:hypothetical protein
MPLTQEQFDKLHTCKVVPIDDLTSRFSFKTECTCGAQGLFFTKEDAEKYMQLHLDRKRLAPY